MSVTAGIDVGSAYTKAVLTGAAGEIIARAACPTGYNFARAAERALAECLLAAGRSREEATYVAATGSGRYQVPFRDLAITELTCHAWAVHAVFPTVRTVLDVGGQTAKAIRLDESGRVKAFRLNDKCAAGSGAFLEKTVRYMGFEAADIPRLADDATDPAEVSSVCTVFAESEVINHLAGGRSAEDICGGAVVALAGRAGQLVKRVKPEPEFALTGGLTRVPLMKRELEEMLACTFLVGDDDLGVYAGAIGAALLAAQRQRKLAQVA
ncbi:MAG: 2-hydroxyglutaryl-CoA dehydratase [Thermoleophilia bacterium]|nr:2-hydroxyglutaryl-CoA dehydratase [Thermoleophilia bacterium]